MGVSWAPNFFTSTTSESHRRPMSLALLCSAAGFHLPVARPTLPLQRCASPVASIDQVTYQLARFNGVGGEDVTSDDGFFGIIQKLFVRDGVDAYYSFLLVIGVGYFGYMAVVNLIENAKAQDEENAKAKADGRAEMTNAFKKAARSGGYEKKRDWF